MKDFLSNLIVETNINGFIVTNLNIINDELDKRKFVLIVEYLCIIENKELNLLETQELFNLLNIPESILTTIDSNSNLCFSYNNNSYSFEVKNYKHIGKRICVYFDLIKTPL